LSTFGRDVYIEARRLSDGVPCGIWEFTVFKVDLSLAFSGEEISPLATSHLGERLVDQSRTITGTNVTGMYSKEHFKHTLFGGSCLTTGTIIPSSVLKSDFISTASIGQFTPGAGFFFERLLSRRSYLSGCYETEGNVGEIHPTANFDNQPDTRDANGKMILETMDIDPDISGQNLVIFNHDAPANNLFEKTVPVNDSLALRMNFTEHASYAGTPCSGPLLWHLAQSIKRNSFTLKDPISDFARDSTYDHLGDNSIGLGHISLAAGLNGLSGLPGFEISSLSSPDASGGGVVFYRNDPLLIWFEISGTNLPDNIQVDFIDVTGDSPNLVTTEISSVTPVLIRGKAAFSDKVNGGLYTAVVSANDLGDCVVNKSVALLVLGEQVAWQWEGRVENHIVNGRTFLLFGIKGLDSVGQPVFELPKKPVVQITGGTINGVVIDISEQPHIAGFVVSVDVTGSELTGNIILTATGNGFSASAEFKGQ
jgi:hypothetical protein